MLTSKRFDGDYSIVSADGTGTITLDALLVDIPGDLLVQGDFACHSRRDRQLRHGPSRGLYRFRRYALDNER